MSRADKPEVICIETLGFYRLIDQVVDHVEERLGTNREDRWINGVEAMRLLGINSRTTLQKYRDEGKLRYTQPTRKVILYDRLSILDFLDAKAHDTF